MTDDRRRTDGDGHRERDDRPAGPVGAVLGATLGPFGAAVGGVVDANRLAVKLSVGTGADADDDGTTIEIEAPESNEKRDADGGAGADETGGTTDAGSDASDD
ncbi:hypothetical protein [Natronomonas marina]|jgi:hypothetical protein|uniref:hypothetical protein n=1 Tax=Natronomonas marina TaxID=2961939 RepID=UPI0020C9CD0E|nr:hypothetical protein [Natronomonas marina]